MRNYLNGLLLLSFISLPCLAQSKPALISNIKSIQSQDQLQEWMTYYYLHPRPDLTVPALRFMDKSGVLKDRTRGFTVATLYAQLLTLNASKAKEWVQEVKKDSPVVKFQLAASLQQSQINNSGKLIDELASTESPQFKDIAQQMKSNARTPDLMKDQIDSPQYLDALWASFFVTGDKKYVQRIISVLALLQPPKDKSRHEINVLGEAAKWSLTSNAKLHPKVMEACTEELKKAPDSIKAPLQSIIAQAKASK